MDAKKLSFIILGATFLLYLVTLNPGVFWGDAGELASTANVLGVPHPTGYPLYMVVGKLAILKPGSAILNLNVLNAFIGAVTVLVLFNIIHILTKNNFASSVGALSFAFSNTFWSQSIIVEVYPLFLLLISSSVYFALKYDKTNNKKHLHYSALLLGLSFSHHLLTLVFIPGFLLCIWYKKVKWKHLRLALLFFLIGLTPYLYLPIRSAQNPALDFGGIDSTADLVKHVTGVNARILGHTDVTIGMGFERIWLLIKEILFSEFFLLHALIVIIALFAIPKQKNKHALISLLLVPLAFNILLGFHHLVSLVVDEIWIYYLPFFMIYAILFGIGVDRLFKITKGYKKVFYALIIIALIIPGVLSFNEFNSRTNFPDKYSRFVLESLPDHSILIASGDNPYYAMLYLQSVEGVRPEVTVIEPNLLFREEFRERFQAERSLLDMSAVNNIDTSYSNGEERDAVRGELLKALIDSNIDKYNFYLLLNHNFDLDYDLQFQGPYYQIEGTSDKFHAFEVKDEDLPHLDHISVEMITYHYTLYGNLLLEQTRTGPAVQIFRKVLLASPTSAEANYNLGAAFYFNKNLDQARYYFQQATILDPDDEQYRQTYEKIK